MKVSQILEAFQQNLACCTPDEQVLAAAERLTSRNIGAMPVCGPEKQLIGIISERDIVRAFAKDGVKLSHRRVRDLMTTAVMTCTPSSTLAEAEKIMHRARVRHLPVVDGAALVGMLSIRDVLAWRLAESRTEVNVLRDAMIAARS